MSEDSDRRAREYFDQLAAIPHADRAMRLESMREEDPAAAAEAESLLSFHELGGAVLDRAPGGGLLAEAASIGPGPIGAGERIGRWTLVESAGAGGACTVYRATDERGGSYAVKVVREELVTPAMRQRFARCELAWPRADGIAAVHEVGVVGTVPYIVTDWADGGVITDAERLEAMNLRARLTLGAAVCDIVARGHAAGVVHGRVHPSNIRWRDGTPMVLDFGVFRLLDEPRETSRTARLRPGLSRVRSLSHYAAPEQLGDAPGSPDERTDVYALGALALELALGRPGTARDAAGAELPVDCGPILRRALAERAAERFQSAAELGDALRTCRIEGGKGERGGWWRRVLGGR